MLLFRFVAKGRSGKQAEERKFWGRLWSLGKNWGYYSGLQRRGEREIGGFTMQQRGTYEHIARKVWREWWTNICGNCALLLLIPMKQHASQIRKPKSESRSVAPGRRIWTTVMLLRKSERKPKPNPTQNKQSRAWWNEAKLQHAFLSGVSKVL